MADLTALIEAGKELGLAGEELKAFVKEQQDLTRDQRALEREKIKQEDEKMKQEEANRELEREKMKQAEAERELHAQIENEKLKLENDRLKQAEMIEMERLRLEERKLEFEKQKKEEETGVSNIKCKLPPFNEEKDKFDAYINRFESYATLRKWKRDQWSIQLSMLLTGKALDTFYGLSEEDQLNYEVVKEALLRKYSLTEDEFRKQFYQTKVELGETPTQYMTRIRRLFAKWIDASKTDKTYDGVCSLIVREQFLRRCHADLAAYLREKKIEEITELASAAQRYLDAHGGTMQEVVKLRRRFNQSVVKREIVTREAGDETSKNVCKICKRTGHVEEKCWYKDQNRRTNEVVRNEKSRYTGSQRCYICNEFNHIALNCPNKNKAVASASVEVNKPDEKRTCSCVKSHAGSACITEVIREIGEMGVLPDTLEKEGQQYIVHGQDCNKPISLCTCLHLPTGEGTVNGGRVKVLRDTGCSTVVVKSTLVKPEQYTGKYKDCMLIDGTVRRFPMAQVQVCCEYLEGEVEALVMTTPVFDLIIGNVKDVTLVQHKDDKVKREPVSGSQIQPDEIVSEEASMKHKCEIVQYDSVGDREKPEKDEMSLEQKVEIDTAEGNLDKLSESQNSKCTDSTVETEVTAAVLTRGQQAASKKKLTPIVVPAPELMTKERLIICQREDQSLKKYWELVGEDKIKKTKNGTVEFAVRHGVLMRLFTHKNASKPVKQVMIPKQQRDKILSVAHDGLMSGHSGIKRTLDRVMSNFYWPGVAEDVTRYCKSCDICQKTTAKGRQVKAPLNSMPLITVPFKRVAVDIVGPIVPCSERGHRYVLTVVDYATRYPEATPLKNIETTTIAEALVEIYCRVGVPDEVLSDRGAQFISHLMKEVSRLLSVKQIHTTPYHPMCNGLVERFNGTLKTILKKLCSECPKQWDRYLPAVLFAYRSSVQESTGFTPFELLFGRKIRGPMDILRAYWTKEPDDEETKTVYRYVVDLEQRLEETCKLAQEELLKSRETQKMYYDRKARPKSLKIGSKVLLLLPLKKNKLLLQWKGPYKVVEKMSKVNYKIQVGNKVKNFHVNMLKPYMEREVEEQLASMVFIDGDRNSEEKKELIEVCPLASTQTWRDVKVNESLTAEQKAEVTEMLQRYDEVLSTLPGCTNVEVHHIYTTTDEPVREKPYPLPYAVRETINKEIEEMLKLGVIRPSNSPYVSIPVIVGKPDGTNRFCTNYQKLNAVTVFDGEPMPNPDDIFLKMRGKKYRSKVDLSKGYWQLMLDEESIPKTAFVVPGGVYEWVRMPFGLKNSAASFNRLMRKVLGDVENVDCFVDDVVIYTDTWKEHIQKWDEVLKRLKEAGLTVKPSKCMIGYTDIEFLGHKVDVDTLQPREEKVAEILEVDRPKTKKQIQSFLGMIGFYSKFISRFADIAKPLSDVTSNKSPNIVQWGQAQESAFQELKTCLSKQPVLQILDFKKEMVVQTDASDTGLGAVLLQEKDGLLHPVRYLSRKLKKAERNYSTIEKECLAIVWAIEKLRVFLYGREFVLLTDHQPLTFINQTKIKNGRVMRWSLFLQDWSFRMQSIKGVDNLIADYLSRV